jgi:hypothetical protein
MPVPESPVLGPPPALRCAGQFGESSLLQTRVGQGQEGQADGAGDDERPLITIGRAHGAEDQGAGQDPQGGGQGDEAGVALRRG